MKQTKIRSKNVFEERILKRFIRTDKIKTNLQNDIVNETNSEARQLFTPYLSAHTIMVSVKIFLDRGATPDETDNNNKIRQAAWKRTAIREYRSSDERLRVQTATQRSVFSAILEHCSTSTVNEFERALFYCSLGDAAALETELSLVPTEQRHAVVSTLALSQLVLMGTTPAVLRVIFCWLGEESTCNRLKGSALLCKAVMLGKNIPYLCQLIQYKVGLFEQDDVSGMNVFRIADQIGGGTERLLFDYVQRNSAKYT